MKKLLIFYFFAVSIGAQYVCHGQTATNFKTGKLPSPTPYTVISRDANSQVWERSVHERGPSGQTIVKKQRYTELATGLNFKDQLTGRWIPSKEEIDILPNGTAAATNGQHQAYFPPNIYTGVIEVVTPDKIALQSKPIGLSYDDGTNTVLIAKLTNSVGQLISSNQVIYTNAFIGVDADLLYTYRKSGFEQDVIFREQPPAPEEFGIDSTNARLELLTEFFNASAPTKTIYPVNRRDDLQDTALAFGKMRMVRGKAFVTDSTNQHSRLHQVPIYKNWLKVDGRTILIEETPYSHIRSQLAVLSSSADRARSVDSQLCKVSSKRLLPPVRLVQAATNVMQMASADVMRKTGVVLDYVEIDTSEQDNYTFHGDTTYYINGNLLIDGELNIEGGAVIKFSCFGEIDFDDSLNMGYITTSTTAYHPAVFTSMNDNSVGETIDDSSGSPGVGDVNTFLNFNVEAYQVWNYLRFSYCNCAVINMPNSPSEYQIPDIWNCQFMNVLTAYYGYDLNLHNVLIESDGYDDFYNTTLFLEGANLVAENVTVDAGAYGFVEADNPGCNVALTNCLIVDNDTLESFPNNNPIISSLSNPVNLLTTSTFYQVTPATPVFQTSGAGNFYLAADSPYRGKGTTNINPQTLAFLQTKTTWPPIIYDNTNISSLGMLSPTVPRDTNSSPDIGYHYDSLDYLVGGCDLYSNLTVAIGTAVGYFEDYGDAFSQPYGLSLSNEVNVSFNGNAAQPCIVTRYDTVQEGGNWGAPGTLGGIIFNGSADSPQPQLAANFTKWSMEAVESAFFSANGAYGQAQFWNSEFYSGNIATYMMPAISFTNCLFWRDLTAFWDQDFTVNFVFENCTFYEGGLGMARYSPNGPAYWEVENTAFDGTAFWWNDYMNGTSDTLFDYNAYNTNNFDWQNYPYANSSAHGLLENVGPHDVNVPALPLRLINVFRMLQGYCWESSWFGDFYLPPTNVLTSSLLKGYNLSPLIRAGSTNANYLGLYHFTTQASQTPEGTNIVDIGYHYVATDNSGNPLDTLWFGMPDYLTDPDGQLEAWELEYFGFTGLDPNSDPDGDGNNLLYDYTNGINPNIIQFNSIVVTNFYSSNPSVTAQLNVIGIPYYMAILVDDANFDDAVWNTFSSTNITLNLGLTEGWHEVRVGLRGHADDASVAQWQWARFKLDYTPPVLVLTGPTNSTVDVPMIQLTGYSLEDLSAISFNLSNSAGLLTNQQICISDRHFDDTIWDFTTNSFQGYDIFLTNGLNTITVYATDMAGNETITNFNFVLDYSDKTNPPAVQLTWPTNATLVTGTSFTLNGQLADPTATVTASITDTSGDSSVVTGLVERTGRFWVQNIPLNPGANELSLTVVDVVGNTTVTNISLIQSPLTLTLDPVDSSSPDLYQPTINLTGTISDPTYAVWVNGVKGKNNGDGTWAAQNVPVDSGGTASFRIIAYSPDEIQPDGSQGN